MKSASSSRSRSALPWKCRSQISPRSGAASSRSSYRPSSARPAASPASSASAAAAPGRARAARRRRGSERTTSTPPSPAPGSRVRVDASHPPQETRAGGSAAPRQGPRTPDPVGNPDKPKRHARTRRTSGAPGGAQRRRSAGNPPVLPSSIPLSGSPRAPTGDRLTTLRLTGRYGKSPGNGLFLCRHTRQLFGFLREKPQMRAVLVHHRCITMAASLTRRSARRLVQGVLRVGKPNDR